MNDIIRGQVNVSAAEIYDQFYLPALFEEWTERVLQAARIVPSQSILDVACGTGVLTLAAAETAGPAAGVIGLDINQGMLAVAQKKSTSIEWKYGRAENLPFPDDHFDAVISQFGLMFFDDRRAAIREMLRVLKPGGRIAVAVWESLDKTPGYAAVTNLLQRLFDDQAADALRAPYVLGDKKVLQSLFSGAGIGNLEIRTYPGKASFPSLESWMYTDVKGWTLNGLIDQDQYELLLAEAENELQMFIGETGEVSFDSPAIIISGYKI
jgi:ubiquinone/menaquinone biosynthesis C-methylase UbiE